MPKDSPPLLCGNNSWGYFFTAANATNKMSELIRSLEVASSTDTGRDWLIKALHPSDPVVECRGVPDGSAVPTVFLNYQTIHRINPPVGVTATDTWNFDLNVIPDAIIHAACVTTITGGTPAPGDSYNIFNTSVPGGDYTLKLGSWLGNYPVRWRLAYYGLTMYQDGPALANQGTIGAAQYAVEPQEWALAGVANVIVAPPPSSSRDKVGAPIVYTTASRLAWSYPLQTLGSYESVMTMPNAHLGPSREGVYMPLRLTETDQDWVGFNDASMFLVPALDPGCDPVGPDGYQLLSSVVMPASFSPPKLPFPSIRGAHIASAGPPPDNSTRIYGDKIFKPLSGMWGYVAGRGLAPTSSMNCFFRVGIELQVVPGSPLSPQQKLSPKEDTQAVDAYFRISRQLKDAYPVEYNDLGKLWDVIKSVARIALPIVGMVPGMGPIASGLGLGVRAIDGVREMARRGPPKKELSAGDIEKMRSDLAAQRQHATMVPRAIRAPRKPRKQRKKKPKAGKVVVVQAAKK